MIATSIKRKETSFNITGCSPAKRSRTCEYSPKECNVLLFGDVKLTCAHPATSIEQVPLNVLTFLVDAGNGANKPDCTTVNGVKDAFSQGFPNDHCQNNPNTDDDDSQESCWIDLNPIDSTLDACSSLWDDYSPSLLDILVAALC